MRQRTISLAIAAAFTAMARMPAADATWSLDGGLAVVGVAGVRSYAIPERKLAHNDTAHVTARYLRLNRTLGDRWSVGAGYFHYGELRASGASGSSDIFDQSEAALTVIVPLEMTDRIDEFTVEGRWHRAMGPGLALSIGPVLSFFDSKAEWGSSYFGASSLDAPIRKVYFRAGGYHETDFRLGAAAGLTFGLTPRFGIQADYRYAASPRRDLHVASAGVRWHF